MPFLPPNQQRQSTEGTSPKATAEQSRDSHADLFSIANDLTSSSTVAPVGLMLMSHKCSELSAQNVTSRPYSIDLQSRSIYYAYTQPKFKLKSFSFCEKTVKNLKQA